MTEKEKAIEDEAIELSIDPTEKRTKKPHRRRAVVITVVALALLAAGGIAWKTHTDRLMAEARADCAAASEHLRIVTNDYNTLLNGNAANAAKTDRKSVKDAKTLDVLSKAVKASTPKAVSCKADSRDAVVTATKAITANTAWYWTHGKSLNRLVKAVETSKLGKTRASLLDAIKKRDADAIAKAVEEVNESKAAKEQADAEAKARAEQEAAAAAAAAQQQAQASQSQTYSGGGSYSNRGYSYSGASSSGSDGSASSPSQSNGGGSSSGSGSDLHIVIGGSGTPAQNGPSHGEPNI